MSSNDSGGASTPSSSIFGGPAHPSDVSSTDRNASPGGDTQNKTDNEVTTMARSSRVSAENALAVAKLGFHAARGIDEVRAIFDRATPATKFYFFPFMPLEIQLSVVRLVFNKPAIHWVRLERCQMERTQLWKYEVKMRPTVKAHDPSSFRKTDKILEGFDDLGMRSTDVFVDPLSLGFEKLPSWIDAATDMVCVHNIFESGIVKHRFSSFVRSPSFHRDFQRASEGLPTMVRPAFTKLLKGIRHVGVLVSRNWYNASNPSFPCPIPDGLHSLPHHGKRPLCSVELAAFFDCFPDLEVAYIVMKKAVGSQARAWPYGAQNYCKPYCSKTQAERDALGLQLFYDSEQKYLEYTKDFKEKLSTANEYYSNEANEMVGLLDETRKVFTEKYNDLPSQDGVQCFGHTMSLESREAVKFKVILSTGIMA